MATGSVELGRAWDDTFHGWTDALQLGRKVKKPARAKGGGGSSGWTGSPVADRAVADYAGKGSKADVRGRLQGIARRSTQVMVKITPGKNKTMRSVRDHLAYIARDGEETVVNQDGQEFKGMDAVADLSWGWQHTGPKTPETSEHRLAFNVMFSMPEGTSERAVFESVKASAEIEFAGHQWAMVQHFDEPQVHCHVCVKAEGMDGQRLNPRKADLQRWRERFAHELRERGVEAEATRRAARMHQERINKPWAVTRIEERGGVTNPTPEAVNSERVKKWKSTEAKAASSYSKIIDALGRSDDAADRVLAKELQQSVAKAPSLNTTARGKTKPSELERN